MKKGKNVMAVTISIVCFLLMMIVFMQFKVAKQTQETDIDTMQETELRQQLANWKTKYEETKEKTQEISNTLETYKKETSSDAKTKETLETELKTLEQALGKTDVEGEGLIISLREKKESELEENEYTTQIYANDLINIVNTLKDAGAEAISINDERIISTTDIVMVGDVDEEFNTLTIKINSKFIRSNEYEIKAIGNSSYLENSVFGKGGYITQIDGIVATAKKSNKVRINKYNGEIETKYIEEVN